MASMYAYAAIADDIDVRGGPTLQPPLGLTPFVLLAISFGSLMILFSPSVRAHTRPGAGTGLASG